MRFHDENDSVEQLKKDIQIGNNPQHSANPDSVRYSAEQELRRRGFDNNTINRWKNE